MMFQYNRFTSQFQVTETVGTSRPEREDTARRKICKNQIFG